MILIYESVFADQLRRVHPAEQDQASFDRAFETAFLARPYRLRLKWPKASTADGAGLQNSEFSRSGWPVVCIYAATRRDRSNNVSKGGRSIRPSNLRRHRNQVIEKTEPYRLVFLNCCVGFLNSVVDGVEDVRNQPLRLLEVGESGEFKRGTLGESKESYKVKTYGRVVAITRQTLINDDLDAFTRIPAMYGNSIAQLESDVVWGIITANPAMADGNALFHTTHKNLAGTGAALDVSSVGAARAAMAKQTGLDKKTVLNIRPAFLIVPASLELKAEQLVAQNLVPAATSSVVPQSIRTLAPISEPRLDAASETAWYLAASPNQIDTIEYAYLEGQQGAYIETRNGFDVDGVEIKCRLDFGAKAIDWRGLYKNPGA